VEKKKGDMMEKANATKRGRYWEKSNIDWCPLHKAFCWNNQESVKIVILHF